MKVFKKNGKKLIKVMKMFLNITNYGMIYEMKKLKYTKGV